MNTPDQYPAGGCRGMMFGIAITLIAAIALFLILSRGKLL